MDTHVVKSAQTQFRNPFSVGVGKQQMLWVRIVICVKWQPGQSLMLDFQSYCHKTFPIAAGKTTQFHAAEGDCGRVFEQFKIRRIDGAWCESKKFHSERSAFRKGIF